MLPLCLACDLETSDNGLLDGYWHLTAIDGLPEGGRTDLSQQTVFWAFQKDLLQLRGAEQEFYLRFARDGGQLRLWGPRLKDRGRNDPAVDELTMPLLQPYGIRATEQVFGIVRLTADGMVLQAGGLQLHFRKM